MDKLIGSAMFAIITFSLLTGCDILFGDVSLYTLSVTGSIVKIIGLGVIGYRIQIIGSRNNKNKN